MKMTEFDKMGKPMTLNETSALINGQHYKIGFCGIVFVYRNGDWCRTDNVTAAEVKDYSNIQEIAKRKKDNEPEKELTPYMIKKLGVEGRKERAK